MCACVLSLAPSPHVYVRLGGIPLLLSLTLFLLIPPYKPPTTAHIASLCDPLSVCLTTYIRMLYESQIINPNHDLCPCDMCSYAFGRTVRTSAGGWTAASTFSRVSEAPVPTCRKMRSAVEDGNHRLQRTTVVRTALQYTTVPFISPGFGSHSVTESTAGANSTVSTAVEGARARGNFKRRLLRGLALYDMALQ